MEWQIMIIRHPGNGYRAIPGFLRIPVYVWCFSFVLPLTISCNISSMSIIGIWVSIFLAQWWSCAIGHTLFGISPKASLLTMRCFDLCVVWELCLAVLIIIGILVKLSNMVNLALALIMMGCKCMVDLIISKRLSHLEAFYSCATNGCLPTFFLLGCPPLAVLTLNNRVITVLARLASRTN